MIGIGWELTFEVRGQCYALGPDVTALGPEAMLAALRERVGDPALAWDECQEVYSVAIRPDGSRWAGD